MLSDQDGYGVVPGSWSSYVLQNRHDMSTGQFWYCGITGCCVDPVSGYQMLLSYFNMSKVSRQTYIETIQPRPFEEWIEKGHQRDTNLCSAYARPTNKRSLVRGGEGYNQGSFVYFAKGCGDVQGRSILSVHWGKTQRHARDRQFIAKNRGFTSSPRREQK